MHYDFNFFNKLLFIKNIAKMIKKIKIYYHLFFEGFYI
jgi:hypothetical protein